MTCCSSVYLSELRAYVFCVLPIGHVDASEGREWHRGGGWVWWGHGCNPPRPKPAPQQTLWEAA